eukprot:gene9911-10924_t
MFCVLLQSSASSSALGILLYGSLSSGLSQNIMESLIEPWLTILTDEMAESEKRVAAICGLMSSFGSWKFLFQFEEFDTFDAALKTKLALIIKTVQQVLQTSDDTKLCLQCSKFLGIFYMVNDGYASKQANLPSNYDYLRESSLLRSAFAFSTEAGKSAKVSCVVYGLIESSSVTLPPVNWSLVFTPLMKLGFSACTQKLCLEFAIENASKFPTLRVWFLSWLTPGIFLNLEDTCKELIFSKFDSISRLVPMNKLKIVLEEITVEAFQNKESNSQLQKSVLCGLEKIANMKSPVQSSLLYVSQAIEKICLGMTIHENEEILKSIADCLVCLPKELKDVVTKNLQMNFDVPAKLDSILLASRKITLTTFQSSLERLLHDPEKIDASSLQRITYALQQYSLGIPPSIKATDDDIMWFLELTTRTKKLADSGKHASLRCWLKLLASAVASWCLAGIIPNIPNSSSQSNSPDYITACWDTFALNLAGLLHLSRWQHLQQRVIEWLVALLEIVRPMKEHDHIGVLLQNCLITLRDCEAWKQRAELWKEDQHIRSSLKQKAFLKTKKMQIKTIVILTIALLSIASAKPYYKFQEKAPVFVTVNLPDTKSCKQIGRCLLEGLQMQNDELNSAPLAKRIFASGMIQHRLAKLRGNSNQQGGGNLRAAQQQFRNLIEKGYYSLQGKESREKREDQERVERHKEDAKWADDDKYNASKQQRKESKEQKRLAALQKKQEAKLLLEQEEAKLNAKSRPSASSSSTKVTRAQIAEERQKQAKLNMKKEKAKDMEPDIFLEENPNQKMAELLAEEGATEARNIEEAITTLSVDGTQSMDKNPEKRMKAAYTAFEAEQLPILKAENPNLRLSQLKQLLRKQWLKSPDNPMNKILG